ncbi:MAG: hypothetical protein HRT88_12065 [Lentisphaeraceae bacterium]|nr:hypothetical protein [Lentisphaeraceae bacterium]
MKTLLILFISFCSVVLYADEVADEREPGKQKKSQREKKPGMDRGRLWEMMKEKYPEDFERLKALRESDMEVFRQEFSKFRHEKLGKFRKMGMKGDGKDRAPMGKGGRGHYFSGRGWFQDLKEKDPQRFEELMKLRQEKPEEFRKIITKEFGKHMYKKKYSDEARKSHEKIRELAHKYRTASEGDKEGLKKELRSVLDSSFGEEQKRRQAMAVQLEQQLSSIKKQISDRKAKKSEYIDQIMERITSGKGHPRGDKKPKPGRDAQEK